ncbi:MAG: CCA tRNA nucleotidyltransferase [Candidatus Thalassarchaeaceae archaeon]|jgi:tRNA nucleotidyltransferase (CCA-adding enzyme)|nr:CCA tRNA nucleotidyltransferase [Candidatus Thalassarchaeaceae archaeon]|tara:strand:- start:1766 stop:3019 length:1254 start_codon:yes stop_codon:yes gene_type:complete
MEHADSSLGPDDLFVLEGLQSKGEAWIVGGWVREFISGGGETDLDIATTLHPEEVKAIFPRSLMVGARFGTVAVRLEEGRASGKIWEVTTLRSDGSYGDGRRPDNVEFGTDITEDLSRRDFTINSMALEFPYNEDSLIDPFNGRKDLLEGVLVSVGDPQDRISEDGLRILRAFRFMNGGKNGVREMGDSLESAISSSLGMLEMVSKERVCSELSIILSGDWTNEIVSKMEELGVLKAISGNLMEKSECPLGSNLEVNLALLCRKFEGDGGQLRKILRKELMLSNSILDEVGFLHECKEESLETNASYLRRFAIALPEMRKKNVLDYLGTLGQDVVIFSKALKEVGEPRYGASPIVDGNELSRETGLPPGPRLGMLKGWLYRRQVEDDLTTFDEVISLLDNLNWENSEPTDWGKLEWP